jgi:hypothetical protein
VCPLECGTRGRATGSHKERTLEPIRRDFLDPAGHRACISGSDGQSQLVVPDGGHSAINFVFSSLLCARPLCGGVMLIVSLLVLEPEDLSTLQRNWGSRTGKLVLSGPLRVPNRYTLFMQLLPDIGAPHPALSHSARDHFDVCRVRYLWRKRRIYPDRRRGRRPIKCECRCVSCRSYGWDQTHLAPWPSGKHLTPGTRAYFGRCSGSRSAGLVRRLPYRGKQRG